MNRNRSILTFVIVTGVGLHLAALIGLHKLPFKSQTKAFCNAITLEEAMHDFFARQERIDIVTDVFDSLQDHEPEVKQEFHELRAEYAPTLEIALNSDPLEIKIEPFGFDFNLKPTTPYEGDLSLLQGSPFTCSLPQSQIEIPPLAQICYRDDPLSAGTIAGSEHFDVEVEYAPKSFKPGYVFKVTFLPRKEVIFKRIRQNIFFLIDRSNSIPRLRYALNKRVVSEALDYLKQGDTFNILIFDDRVVKLGAEPLEWNEANILEARTFLEKQGHGGLFAATELYASLDKIIPQNVSDQEVNTALLLSDGDTYLSQEKQRRMIGEWTLRNQGKVELFSIASGPGNNLPLLDLISAFNLGNLIYTPDHNNLNSLTVNLMQTIQAPIGKDMVATPIAAEKQTLVLLQPKAIRLQNLFQHRPYIIYGSTNTLSDFILFLQGKYYDQHFDIKKKISFKGARLSSLPIERKWTQLLAHEHYARYFEDGNTAHLEAAKQLLLPLNIPTAWID